MRKNICPVCGYPDLDRPAWESPIAIPSFDICPSCGCEFGYNDATPKATEQYRRKWVKRGAPWFKPELKPDGWDLGKQLKHIGVELDDLDFE